jgi:hypothetical protein
MKNTPKIDPKTIKKSYFLGSWGVPGGVLGTKLQKGPLFPLPFPKKCSF